MSKKVIIIGSGIAGISSSLKLKSYFINSIIVCLLKMIETILCFLSKLKAKIEI